MPEQLSIEDLIRREAEAADIPVALALGVAEQESRFNPTALGPALDPQGTRAIGTFQLLPSTAALYNADPNDPLQNVQTGVRYLKDLLARNPNDLDAVLRTYGGVRTNTTYVPEVLARVQRFQQLEDQRAAARARPQTLWERVTGSPAQMNSDVQAQYNAMRARMAGQPPPPVPPTPWVTDEGGLKSLGMDPRDVEGRQNIAGMVGGGVGGFFGGPLGSTLGAGAAGGLEQLGEEAYNWMVGTPPPEGTSLPGRVFDAAGTQFLYDAAGQAIAAPLRAGGRRLVESKVSRFALQELEKLRTDSVRAVQDAIEWMKTSHRDAALADRRTRRSAVGFANEQQAADIAAARAPAQAAAEATAIQQAKGEGLLANERQKYVDDLIATPPAEAAAGGLVRKVYEGPAQAARDALGEQVTAVAAQGPTLDLSPVVEEASRVLMEELALPATTFPSNQTLAALGMQAGNAQLEQMIQHPAMQLLLKFLNMTDPSKVPFLDAHLFKSEMQQALAASYTQTIKPQVTNIAQHLIGQMREIMGRVHPDYNVINESYGRVAKLMTEDYGKTILSEGLQNPSKLVQMVKVDDPDATRHFVEILTDLARRGGNEQLGQQALQAVQEQWVRRNLMLGGIEGLRGRLDDLLQHGEFVDAFFPGTTRQVLDNAEQVAYAYETKVLETARDLAAAEARQQVAEGTADQGVAAARQQAGQAKETARRIFEDRAYDRQVERQAEQQRLTAARQDPRLEEFERSTLSPQHMNRARSAVNRAIASALAYSAARWRGVAAVNAGFAIRPRASQADLLQYAIYSPERTRAFVEHFAASTKPGWLGAQGLRATEAQTGYSPADLYLTIQSLATPPPRPGAR